ncbi:rod shape-determining protein RodA [Ectothiorhodospiraceae bacterium WFHF3C12]|nr:rod shape-determining protein RodA [Ectothiorhodospiraceae bacterium WFHF3C12]
MGSLQRRLHLDGVLLGALVLIAGLGLVVLYSAFGANMEAVQRQLTRLAVAFAAMLVVAQLSPQALRRWAPWLYIVGLAMLVAVVFFGVSGGGAQRWLNLGVARFQPSELMKVALPMMLAYFLADGALPPRWRRLGLSVVMIAVPAALIGQQPDLGTAVIVAASGFFVLFLAGLPWRLLIGTAIAAGPAAAVLWFYFMHDYQRQRVLTFLNPERDPLGAGYHIIQSKIAIGSGGVYGKGFLNGTQAQLEFLPERHTDFIFAVLSEEFGLVGVGVLLCLYAVVVARGAFIAARAQDTFSRLLAGSIAMTFFVYVFVNVGMVTGLLPVVGLPLPLVSYGGTFVVTMMIGFGMLMSIHTHRRLWTS